MTKTPSQEPNNVLEVAISEIEARGGWDFMDRFDEDIIADLRLRSKIGEFNYGTPLQIHNGRNALIDLYEEMLDAYMYAVQYDKEKGYKEGIVSLVLDTLRTVAEEISISSPNKGFLNGAKQPMPITEVERKEISDYAGYNDVYRWHSTTTEE